MISKRCTIVFEDNHLLVVDKPAGLLTQPTDASEESAEGWAKAWIKSKCGKPGNVFLHAVHRLDRPVSGIVVFARTSKALSRLNEAMRSKSCRKIYHALVEGAPPSPEGRLEHYLTHDHHRATVFDTPRPEAVKATLVYRVLERRGDYTLVEIELETGRYHQIRAQLAAVGCPIVNDVKYGSRTGDGSIISLQHVSLTIPHPITKADLVLSQIREKI